MRGRNQKRALASYLVDSMNFLSVDDISNEQIKDIFEIADDIKSGKGKLSIGKGTTLALLFEKPSTRTRVSFEVAMARLGGSSIYLDFKTSQLSRGETIEDTSKVLSLYVDFIAARLFSHETLLALANSASIPVINALTDLEHPTQSLADLYTIREKKGRIRGLRIAFLGDVAQNTANSLMLAAVKLGASFALVGPKKFAPNPTYLLKSREHGVVEIYDDMEGGLEAVDVIYTDTFVSMGQEHEAEEKKSLFAPYQLNGTTLKYAKGDAVVMHPLPAFREVEITEEVLNGPQSIIWEQAANKLLLEQAILLYLSEKSI